LRYVTGWDIDGLKSEGEKETYDKVKKYGRTRAQRDLFWTRRAVKTIYRGKLSGYSRTLLIISIGAAKK